MEKLLDTISLIRYLQKVIYMDTKLIPIMNDVFDPWFPEYYLMVKNCFN